MKPHVAPARLRAQIAVTLAATLMPGVSAAKGDSARGKVVYDKWCEQCHGADGDGNGVAAKFMLPRPRIFKENAAYKFRTTAIDALPTDQDLFRSITEGLPGSAMPDFKNLTQQQRWDVVTYIKSLAEEFSDPEELKAVKPFPELQKPPARPEATAASLKTGKDLYQKNKCWQCHGQNGRGNGPSWPTLYDVWEKTPILPANLVNAETYRGGASPTDIYRSITSSLRGSPMPEYRSAIKDPKQRWHLVNYVMSLHEPRAKDPGEEIVAKRVAQVPSRIDDKLWSTAPAARLRTFPNVIESPRLFWQSVEFITVRALYGEKKIALLIEWDDRSHSRETDTKTEYEDRDTKIYTDTKHPDQIAVQFPAKQAKGRERPYLLMGDRKLPVNLWWWRADEGDQGKASERSAKGASSVSFQTPDSQQLAWRAKYDDGRYSLLLSRPLVTEDTKNDVQFIVGQFAPILFNVWDGRRGELNQRRALTAWYWLYLEPPKPKSAIFNAVAAALVTFLLLLGVTGWLRRTSVPGASSRVRSGRWG